MPRPAKVLAFLSLLLIAALDGPHGCRASQWLQLSRDDRLKLSEHMLPLASHVLLATVLNRVVLSPAEGKPPIMLPVQLTVHVDDYVKGDLIAGDSLSFTGVDFGFESTLRPGVRAVLTMRRQHGQFFDIAMTTPSLSPWRGEKTAGSLPKEASLSGACGATRSAQRCRFSTDGLQREEGH
jgi:hypothetical protein